MTEDSSQSYLQSLKAGLLMAAIEGSGTELAIFSYR